MHLQIKYTSNVFSQGLQEGVLNKLLKYLLEV